MGEWNRRSGRCANAGDLAFRRIRRRGPRSLVCALRAKCVWSMTCVFANSLAFGAKALSSNRFKLVTVMLTAGKASRDLARGYRCRRETHCTLVSVIPSKQDRGGLHSDRDANLESMSVVSLTAQTVQEYLCNKMSHLPQRGQHCSSPRGVRLFHSRTPRQHVTFGAQSAAVRWRGKRKASVQRQEQRNSMASNCMGSHTP
jgi:hypothetical protein